MGCAQIKGILVSDFDPEQIKLSNMLLHKRQYVIEVILLKWFRYVDRTQELNNGR